MKRITVRSLAAPAAAVVLALTGTATAQAQSARPDSINDGSFDTNSGASVVTGTVWFDSATSFHLTTVKLTDKICGDSRAAEFRVIVVDMDGRTIDFGWHSLVNDCASPITWSNLPGSISSAYINYLEIQTNACSGGLPIDNCSSSAYSRHFSDPYS